MPSIRSYDVYGARTQTSGSVNIAWGYTGREHDADTGLNYNRDRYLALERGVWTQRDRLRLGAGSNRYEYMNSAPTVGGDPSGMSALVLYGDPTPQLGQMPVAAIGDSIGENVIPAQVKYNWSNPLFQLSYGQAVRAAVWRHHLVDPTQPTDIQRFTTPSDFVAVSNRARNYDVLVYVGHASAENVPLLNPTADVAVAPDFFKVIAQAGRNQTNIPLSFVMLEGCEAGAIAQNGMSFASYLGAQTQAYVEASAGDFAYYIFVDRFNNNLVTYMDYSPAGDE